METIVMSRINVNFMLSGIYRRFAASYGTAQNFL